MEIRKAERQDSQQLQEFMLKALKTDPAAFSLSFEECERAGIFWWDNYLYSYFSGQGTVMLLAVENGEVAGMTGILMEKKEKRKHVATLAWVYVSPEFRGKGVAKNLMEEALQICKETNGVEKIMLNVYSEQLAAIKMYESFGFEKVGNLKNEIKIGNIYYNQVIMEKFI